MSWRIALYGVIACAVAAGVTCPLPARAVGEEIALNGTYTAVSDGQWAKTNYSYHDETTVTSRWTVTSTCTTYQDCTGRVVSDAGWTADLVYMSGRWRAKRTVDNWEPCADGSVSPGEQSFEFWRPRTDADSSHLVGWDRTTGPSGACGINQWLVIQMPLTLTAS